jgi:hypothetical protein
MPTFTIRITNSDFSDDTQHDWENLELAREEALKSALQIGTDEVIGGSPYFGAEVSVEQDGATVARLVVSIGAAPLTH